MAYEDITPETFVLLGIANEAWNIKGALAELIDNSFGVGGATSVRVDYVRKSRCLTVIDDGDGIENITDLFQLGRTRGSGPQSISKYGQGGTRALLWLAGNEGEVLVATMRRADRTFTATTVDYGEIQRTNMWRIPVKPERLARPSNTPAALYGNGGGTYITLGLRPRKVWDDEAIRTELQRIYAPGIRQGRQIIWSVNGHDPKPLAAGKARPVQSRLTIELNGLTARGEVWYDSTASKDDSYIAICYGPREIVRATKCYGDYDGVGVGGYLELGDGWKHYLTTTKTEFHDQEMFDSLMLLMYRQLEPLLKRAASESDQIKLDLLGCSLAASIEGSFDVDVVATPTGGGGGGGPGPGPEPGPEPGPAPEPALEPDDTGEETKKERAGMQCRLAWLSNEKMSGRYIDIDHSNLDDDILLKVTLNLDIPHVIAAQDRRSPEREMLLQALVFAELSAYIDDELSEAEKKRVLRPNLRLKLEELGGTKGRRFLAATLLKNGAKSAQALAS